MPATSRPTIGIAVLALLAVVDILWLVLGLFGVLGGSEPPPTLALVLFALVGTVTLAIAEPARRGNRTAAWVLVGSRLVSVLLVDLPAFVLGAPASILAIVSATILLTVVGIWGMAPLLSRSGATGAPSRAA
jgi:hypothetical protein